MTMPRIAMISEHASPIAVPGSTDVGGQNVYVDQVSRGLAGLGYLVDVYTRADDSSILPVRHHAPGVRVIAVTAGPRQPIPKDAIWSYIEEFRASTESLAREHGPYDLIHSNFWMSGWVGAQLKTQWRVPLVTIFHALGSVKQRHQGAADTSPSERCDVERGVLAASDRVISQCPDEVDELISFYGADRSRIRIVPSGVDVDRFRPICRGEARHALSLSTDERLIVYVGRVLPRKDVENVIRAVARLREQSRRPVRLIVVGGETDNADLDREPEMSRLVAIAGRLGARDAITFVGRRPSDRLRWYYSAADVFASTPWYEPYGLTPIEAMACATPVVCSAVGGITFTVVDGVTGFLVPPGDPDQLADRLERILNDDDLRTRMADAARRRVEEEFTWTTVARRTADVYHELLGGGRG